MLVTQIKPTEELRDILPKSLYVIHCLGCKEVHFPLEEAKASVEQLRESGVKIEGEEMADYVCRPDFTEKRLKLYAEGIKKADGVLVYACGVGIQTVAEKITDIKEIPVFTGCNTVRLSGYAGLMPTELDCMRCGECILGLTAGICPVANCAKGLVNGPCGGAINGKCEISSEKDCIWLLICDRLKKQGRLKMLDKINPVKDYITSEKGVKF